MTIPALAGDRVVTLSSRCGLRAHDVASGRVLWQVDLKARFGTAVPPGCGPAPFVDGGRLILQTGGKPEQRLVALDLGSGEVVWASAGAERPSRSSPVAAEIAGVRQLLLRHADKMVNGISGIRISDGAVLWSATLPPGFVLDSPLALPGDRILLTTVNDARLLRVTREGDAWRAETVWDSKELQAGVSPPVFHDGRLYGFEGEFLTCIDAETGRGAWKEKLYPASLMLVDGHLVTLSQSAGLLRVVQASAAGYREKARLQIFTPGAQGVAPPSYAGGPHLRQERGAGRGGRDPLSRPRSSGRRARAPAETEPSMRIHPSAFATLALPAGRRGVEPDPARAGASRLVRLRREPRPATRRGRSRRSTRSSSRK